jgi:hypothetical protein
VSGSDQALSTRDRLEIEELYARACRKLDFPDPDGYAELFTEDGSFGRRTADGEMAFQHVGADALRAFVSKMAEVRAGLARHWITNIILEADPVGARGSCYTMLVRNNAETSSVEIVVTGTFEDLIVRTPTGWRFRERVVVDDR